MEINLVEYSDGAKPERVIYKKIADIVKLITSSQGFEKKYLDFIFRHLVQANAEYYIYGGKIILDAEYLYNLAHPPIPLDQNEIIFCKLLNDLITDNFSTPDDFKLSLGVLLELYICHYERKHYGNPVIHSCNISINGNIYSYRDLNGKSHHEVDVGIDRLRTTSLLILIEAGLSFYTVKYQKRGQLEFYSNAFEKIRDAVVGNQPNLIFKIYIGNNYDSTNAKKTWIDITKNILPQLKSKDIRFYGIDVKDKSIVQIN